MKVPPETQAVRAPTYEIVGRDIYPVIVIITEGYMVSLTIAKRGDEA
jgi:hypothetical protein